MLSIEPFLHAVVVVGAPVLLLQRGVVGRLQALEAELVVDVLVDEVLHAQLGGLRDLCALVLRHVLAQALRGSAQPVRQRLRLVLLVHSLQLGDQPLHREEPLGRLPLQLAMHLQTHVVDVGVVLSRALEGRDGLYDLSNALEALHVAALVAVDLAEQALLVQGQSLLELCKQVVRVPLDLRLDGPHLAVERPHHLIRVLELLHQRVQVHPVQSLLTRLFDLVLPLLDLLRERHQRVVQGQDALLMGGMS